MQDTDRCRNELLKICYGVWDHMKNHGDHGVDNWELEWIGFVPGKRETRRYVGEYVVSQGDVESVKKFDDTIAYAGWTMDDHFPEGFYYKHGISNIHHPAHYSIHRMEIFPKSESEENRSYSYQQSQIPWIQLLQVLREM